MKNPDLAAKHAEARRLDAAKQKILARRQARAAGGNTEKTAIPADDLKQRVLGSPWDGRFTRKGESVNTSRGYEYTRLVGLMTGQIPPENCKVELETAMQLDKAMHFCPGFRKTNKSIIAPLSMAFMSGSGEHAVLDSAIANEITQKTWAATAQFDPDEAESLLTKKGWSPDSAKAAVAQSWMQQAYGGALIPMPEMGPLIPLLRNKNALLNAGATMMPLPPGGRIAFPRQTTASTVTHVGEGQSATQTNVQTDQFLLSAKKIIGLLLTNNELIRFGGPVVEQLFRNDLIKSLSLQLDFDCLQGAGSNNVIAGLIGYPGVTSYATVLGSSNGVSGNGNSLWPQDLYGMRAQVFNANAETFDGWVIHPLLFGTLAGKRASVLGSGDNLGLFLFDLTRRIETGPGGSKQVDFMCASKLTQSTNCPLNRTKGSGTGLTTLYGGQWSDYHIGTFGTVEIALAEQGTPYFAQDQTQIRAILSADAGPYHPGVFCYYDQLLTGTVGG